MLAALLGPLLAAPAQAAESHLDLALGTELPLQVGVRAQAELPQRVRASLGAGILPSPYLDLVNEVCVGFGWYTEPTALLIEAALNNALVLQLQGGWRPWEDRGWTIDGGYALALLGGGLARADTARTATSGTSSDDSGEIRLGATAHMVTLTAGHQWLFGERWLLRTTVGGAFTAGASVTAQVQGGSGAGSRALESATEVLLEDTLTGYVHTPTLGVHLGYRFF